MKKFFQILILLTPFLAFGQMGYYSTAGTIGAHVTTDCEVAIWTIQKPGKQSKLLECRYEWWRHGDEPDNGILAYIDCLESDTFYFPFPIQDSFTLRKRVFWQTTSGTHWASSNEITLFTECTGPVPITADPPNEAEYTASILGSTLNVETTVPGVWVATTPFGLVVGYNEFETGISSFDLSYLPPGISYIHCLFKVNGQFENITLTFYQ